jgi:tetratricopeptide (TPR) repeat protein
MRNKYMRTGILMAVFLSILSLPLAADSYKEALKLFQEARYQDSLTMVAKILSVDKDMEPDSPNYKLRFLAAHNHWKLGNHKSAIAHFKRCMDIKSDVVGPYVDLSLMLLEMRRYHDVNTYARRGLKIKEDPMLYYVLGKAALGYKNYWRAKEFFEKSLSLDPELFISYNELGIVLMKMDRYSQANTAFSAALALKPDSPEILNNIALSLERMKKYPEAYGYLKNAKALAPDHAEILKNFNRLKEIVGEK